MQVNPYLNFDGDCAEAFKFYERVLEGRLEGIMTNAESPVAGQTPPGGEDKVLHARLVVGDTVIMGSDAPPGYYSKPQGLFVSLSLDDGAKAERIFNALADGGRVLMPYERTFWAERFGMLVDRYGTPWMVNYEGAASGAAPGAKTGGVGQAR